MLTEQDKVWPEPEGLWHDLITAHRSPCHFSTALEVTKRMELAPVPTGAGVVVKASKGHYPQPFLISVAGKNVHKCMRSAKTPAAKVVALKTVLGPVKTRTGCGYLRPVQSELLPLLDAAIRASFAAGTEILAIYGTDFTTEQKADKSPLTEADKRAHQVIAQELSSTGLPLVSEEGKTMAPAERQAWQRYWLVDPLDGTKEFIKRNGEFTVNIALIDRGAPIGGALYVPVKDTLYFAWQGGGAYRVQQARNFMGKSAYELAALAERLPVQHQRNTFTIVASRSHSTPETEAFIKEKEAQHGSVQLTSVGSALKICLVAEGAADVYPRYAPTMEWDTAAGHAIALEAGRDITDVSTGKSMRYNKNELVNNWFIVQ